jgi:EAL domain-containing protein (putative c-di-GMP-specific phosphodiesterase class I)
MSFPTLHESLGISELLVYFQPVIDLGTLDVVGVEALLRPRSPDGEMLAPGVVFAHAREIDLECELDRSARAATIEAFAAEQNGSTPVLFLNYSAKTWEIDPLDFDELRTAMTDAGIDPQRVAIEIVESDIDGHDAITTFVRSCKDGGFLLSLDNFGTEHSNLERVVEVQPDVIRVDKSVTHGASTSASQRTLLRSITHLARTMGALSLAEGIETYDDLSVCARDGVSFAQGFFLGRPASGLATARTRGSSTVTEHRQRLRADLETRIKESRLAGESREDEIAALMNRIADTRDDALVDTIRDGISSISDIECAYAVDLDGIQITPFVHLDTVSRIRRFPVEGDGTGRDLSLKDFVYGPLTLGQRRFVSQASLSVFTGRPSYTIATRCATADRTEIILCVDLPSGG